MSDQAFEELDTRGRNAVRSGSHDVETAAVDGGPRWGLSIVLRPRGAAVEHLDQLSKEAVEVAGGHHWRTGQRASSHVTVRSLEPHRVDVALNDPAVAHYSHALQRAAERARRVTFSFGGLILTPISIMVRAQPEDEQAEVLSDALADALGAAGWYEAERTRTIWYLNVVHFAGPLTDPNRVIDWVTARRDLDLGATTCERLDLVRWKFIASTTPVPAALASATLT